MESSPLIRLEVALIGSYYFRTSEPILLKLWAINIRDVIVQVVKTNIFRDYEVKVVFDNGQPVAMKPEGLTLLESVNSQAIFQRIIFDLNPGEIVQLESSLDLIKLFHLDKPGSYAVYVVKKAGTDKQVILSNLVSFAIVA